MLSVKQVGDQVPFFKYMIWLELGLNPLENTLSIRQMGR